MLSTIDRTFRCTPEDEISISLSSLFKSKGSDFTFLFPEYMEENARRRPKKNISELTINGIPLMETIDTAFNESSWVILTLSITYCIAPIIQKYLQLSGYSDYINQFRIFRHGGHMIIFMFSNKSYRINLPQFTLDDNQNKRILNSDYEVDEQVLLFKYITPQDSVLQLGGNIGTSCILVDKLTKSNVCVEPNAALIPLLQRNKAHAGANFVIIDGIVSNKEGFVLVESDDPNKWGSFIKGDGEGKIVKNYDFNELNRKYKFTVLFADCEGCLESFFTEYPNALDGIEKIIFEKDQEEICDYTLVINFIKEKGFKHIEGDFHQVYLR